MHEVARTADEIPQRQHNEDRMRRAKSWHERSEEATSDGERFIFLWIAFNAAYGSDASDSVSLTQRRQSTPIRRSGERSPIPASTSSAGSTPRRHAASRADETPPLRPAPAGLDAHW